MWGRRGFFALPSVFVDADGGRADLEVGEAIGGDTDVEACGELAWWDELGTGPALALIDMGAVGEGSGPRDGFGEGDVEALLFDVDAERISANVETACRRSVSFVNTTNSSLGARSIDSVPAGDVTMTLLI